jgi:hypothetical protein
MGGGDARRRSRRKARQATKGATTPDVSGAADPFLSHSAARLETTADESCAARSAGAAQQKESEDLSSLVAA